MTHGPPDTTNEALAAEDLLVIERRRSLTEPEQRRLNMCLAASEPLQWLRQLGRDFDANATERDDDATITQACVDAARKHFLSQRRVGSRSVRAGLRVSAVVVTLLLLSISAAAGWYRWSNSSTAAKTVQSVSVSDPAQEQRLVRGHNRAHSEWSVAAPSVTTDASCPNPVAAASAATVGSASGHPASARERMASSSTTSLSESKTAAELFSDANAARRSGDTDRAVSSYRRLQSEHPRTDEALLSHVLLARLELGRGAAGAALRQFDAYLLQAANGSLAQEALQGKAQALSQLGRKQEATATWRQLLTRYPTSIYAESAREHLGEGSR